jgi:hypothetical protein
MTAAAPAAITPLVIGESPDLPRSVRLGPGASAGASATTAAAATSAGRGTTLTALGRPSPATTRFRLSAAKLIASPCGESGNGIRTGVAARAPATSEPVSGQT